MTFENFYLDMDHDGTYKYLGLDNPTVTKRVNGNKNIHLANGSHMLFSPGSVDESAPESFNKKKYKLGGLYLEGGTLNFENLELDHTKFVKNADDSILTVKTLNFNSAEKSVNVNFAKQADSNFNLWENQNDESQNYLIRATTGVSQNEVEILNLAPDGLYTQTLNQTASSSDGDDAKLHWKVEDLGLKGNVLKYASTLQAIELLRTEDGSGFIVDPKGGSETVKVKLTGSGNVKFETGTVTLASTENDYSGKTSVITNSTLVIGQKSSLGKTTGLINDGTVEASLVDKDVVVYGQTINNGTLIIGEKTFTTETYEGKEGSTIQVSTLLKGKDSKTGMLVVKEKATGKGKVDVQVREGSEARALDRLDVVTMAPGSTLWLEIPEDKRPHLGEYTYMLVRTDNDSNSDRAAWYLTTTKKTQQVPEKPSEKPDPEDDDKPDHASGQTHAGEDENPDNHGGTGGGSGGSDVVWTTSTLKTPQAGARAGLAYLAAEVFDLSLRGHVGDRVYHDLLTGEERETSLWMLNMGNWSRFGDTTSQLGFDGRTNVTHLGGDIYKWNLNETDTLRIGLLGSYGEADYNTKSDVTWLEADAKFEGWSVGAYASWQTRAESGPFANGQIRWNHFENEVREERLEKDKYDSEGLSATFEAGWTQRLFTKKNPGGCNMAFDLEPRAHFYWMDFDADTGFDSTGQRFDTDGKSNLMTSLGVRASLKLTDDVMPQWNDPAMHFFVEGNWVHYSRDFNATVMNEKGSSTATVDLEDFAEARLGAVMHLSDDFLVWGDFNLRSGEDDYESYGYNVGAKYFY